MKHFVYALFSGLLLCGPFLANSQTGVLIGDTAQAPHSSAVLELRTNQKGFLVPRLTTTQRNAIVSPAVGLMLYNTTTSCLQAYLPQTGWRNVACDCQTPPVSTFTNAPNSPSINTNVTFTPTTPGMNYSWTFQGGNPATSSAQSPVVQWANAGTYQVTLTVTDNQGCNSTTTASIVIINCPPPGGNTMTFSYTGAVQNFVVPACATQATIECWGAEGNKATGPGQGYIPGKGGYCKGTITGLTPGETLYVYVGGQGGYNGGGTGWSGSAQVTNGGGASDVRRVGNSLSDRIIAAGGGGGVGGESNWGNGGNGGGGSCGANYCGGQGGGGYGFSGGAGGASGGSSGTNCHGGGGGGGGLNSGGTGAISNCYGNATAGTGALGIGGNGAAGVSGCCQSYGVGGGGGGYYGGGGSAGGCCGGGGGGGGSSWTGTLSNPTFTAGVRTGNGQVIITY